MKRMMFAAGIVLASIFGMTGTLVAQDNKTMEENVKWIRKAAELGDAEAQFNLGVRYANGQGVEKDEEEAAEFKDFIQNLKPSDFEKLIDKNIESDQ